MHTVLVSDEIRGIVDRHVAAGVAATEADFVEEAVRRYAEDPADDESTLIAAAEEGIAAVERGDYVTIAGPDDVAALWDRVWERAMVLAGEMRATGAGQSHEVRTKAQPGK